MVVSLSLTNPVSCCCSGSVATAATAAAAARQVVMAGMEVLGFVMRRRGWQWQGPRLGQLLSGASSGLGRTLGLEAGW